MNKMRQQAVALINKTVIMTDIVKRIFHKGSGFTLRYGVFHSVIEVQNRFLGETKWRSHFVITILKSYNHVLFLSVRQIVFINGDADDKVNLELC